MKASRMFCEPLLLASFLVSCETLLLRDADSSQAVCLHAQPSQSVFPLCCGSWHKRKQWLSHEIPLLKEAWCRAAHALAACNDLWGFLWLPVTESGLCLRGGDSQMKTSVVQHLLLHQENVAQRSFSSRVKHLSCWAT